MSAMAAAFQDAGYREPYERAEQRANFIIAAEAAMMKLAPI